MSSGSFVGVGTDRGSGVGGQGVGEMRTQAASAAALSAARQPRWVDTRPWDSPMWATHSLKDEYVLWVRGHVGLTR